MGIGGQRHSPAALLRCREAVPISADARWVLVPVSVGAQNFTHRDMIPGPSKPWRAVLTPLCYAMLCYVFMYVCIYMWIYIHTNTWTCIFVCMY